ncbi:MAG: Gfo/Idh/MocA family oxidoreductase [Cyclobacteriaceae bacterium]|nr:Gfo/Idh/MocA family oxidoreductase [Cyclobacteriaceae bacterium]
MGDKIRLGLIGGGLSSFIGIVHRVAAYMGENYVLTGGVFDVDFDKGNQFAAQLELDAARSYPSLEIFIEKELALAQEERIQVVSILTPNFLHFEMAKKLVSAGFNVICEKPITVTADEARSLEKLVQEKRVVFGLTHTYTGYPMIRQMKSMIAQGKIGRIQKVDAQYYQGWINPSIHQEKERKKVWRLNPKMSGLSCCMGDIGVHAFNLIEYTTGLEIDKVLADLDTLYPENELDVDGTTLLRMNNGSRGVITASQIATGEENNLSISVYGDKGGLKWEQEHPMYLKHLIEGAPTQIYKPGNTYNSDFALESTKIAPGHPEGLFDAMGNIYNGVAAAIQGKPHRAGAFPTVHDGVRGMSFIEAVLSSSSQGQVWVKVS